MSILNIGSNYHSSAEDPNGGGGASGTAITPEVQAIIDKQINEQVTGLKAKNTRVSQSPKKKYKFKNKKKSGCSYFVRLSMH